MRKPTSMKQVKPWLLNAWDGISLWVDELLGREQCGAIRPGSRRSCDRPAGHSGGHRDRQMLSPFTGYGSKSR